MMRGDVQASPMHDSAALMRTFERPQDWSTCEGLSFWIRPEKDLAIRAIELRLRVDRGNQYSGPSDLDEMMLFGGTPTPAVAVPESQSKEKGKKPTTPVDRPGAPPE